MTLSRQQSHSSELGATQALDSSVCQPRPLGVAEFHSLPLKRTTIESTYFSIHPNTLQEYVNNSLVWPGVNKAYITVRRQTKKNKQWTSEKAMRIWDLSIGRVTWCWEQMCLVRDGFRQRSRYYNELHNKALCVVRSASLSFLKVECSVPASRSPAEQLQHESY